MFASCTPLIPPNIDICPASAARKWLALAATSWSSVASSAARSPKLSIAPTFIKPITRKLFPVLKNRFGSLVRHRLGRALDELVFVLGDLIRLFFRDGLAQLVRLRCGIPAQLNSGAHDLFLINRDAECIAKN